MIIRYVSNLAVAVAGGFLVVATGAFAATAAASLTFALAVALTVVSLFVVISQASIAQRVVSGVGVVLGAWTIVASLVFATTTVVSLGFASALAFVGLGIVGLTAHEVNVEHAVESVGMETDTAPTVKDLRTDRQPAAA